MFHEATPAGAEIPALRLLVCGFGPFPGVAVNPAARFARALLRRRRPALSQVKCDLEILPTQWDSLARLASRLERDRPDGILLLGVAPRRRRVDVEIRAVNAASWRPDATRRRFAAGWLVAGGRPVRATTAPVTRLLLDLRRAGVPAGLSRDAGRYLCNASYYTALGGCDDGRTRPAIFVHLPGRSGLPAGTKPAQLVAALSDLMVTLARSARDARRRRQSAPG